MGNFYVVFCGAVLFFLTGCAQMAQLSEKMEAMFAEQRLAEYNNCADKTVVDSFYTISSDGRTYGLFDEFKSSGFSLERLTSSSISINQLMFKESNIELIRRRVNNYNYDSSSDSIAKTYIKMANSRGNKVKLYKPAMGKIINGIFKQPFEPGENRVAWYDLDNALIEYDPSGQMISCLVRAHQARVSLGVMSYQFSTVYFGSANMRHFENNVKNSAFSEYIIREL